MSTQVKKPKTSDLSLLLYWLERAAAKSVQIKHIFLPESGEVDKIHVTWYGDDVDPSAQRIISTQISELSNIDKEESVARIKRAVAAAPQLYTGCTQRAGLGITIPGICLRDNRFDPHDKAMVIYALTYFAEDLRVDAYDLVADGETVRVSFPAGEAHDVGRRPQLTNALLEFLISLSAQIEHFWDEKDDAKRVTAMLQAFNKFDRKKNRLRITRTSKRMNDRPVIDKAKREQAARG